MSKLVIFVLLVIAIGIFAGRAYKTTLKRFDEAERDATRRREAAEP